HLQECRCSSVLKGRCDEMAEAEATPLGARRQTKISPTGSRWAKAMGRGCFTRSRTLTRPWKTAIAGPATHPTPRWSRLEHLVSRRHACGVGNVDGESPGSNRRSLGLESEWLELRLPGVDRGRQAGVSVVFAILRGEGQLRGHPPLPGKQIGARLDPDFVLAR